MVATNENGKVLKVWTKIYDLCTPIQVEAVVILWVFNLVNFENWCNIIVEGDAKNMF